MKILVTGATGFLGSHLCRRLTLEGHQVTAFHRPNSDVTPLQGLDLEHARGDILKGESINRAVPGHSMVIHSAARIFNLSSLQEMQKQVNIDGTHNVIMACKRHGVQRFLHISSVAAIGISSDPNCPADETFSFNLEKSGLSYQLSKRRAEEEVLKESAYGFDALVVNPSFIWGPFGTGYRGGEIIEKVLQRRIIPYFQGGVNVVHVEDVVEGILRAMHQGRSGERYILGGENVSFRRIGEVVAECLGSRRMLLPVPVPIVFLIGVLTGMMGKLSEKYPHLTYITRYPYQFYDSSKAKKELRYNPRSFAEIVREYFSKKYEINQKASG